jgi:hypothetical protein
MTDVKQAKASTGPYFVVGTYTCNKDRTFIQLVTTSRAEVTSYLRELKCEPYYHGDEETFASDIKLDLDYSDVKDGNELLACVLSPENTTAAFDSGKLMAEDHCAAPEKRFYHGATVHVFYATTPNMNRIWRELDAHVR